MLKYVEIKLDSLDSFTVAWSGKDFFKNSKYDALEKGKKEMETKRKGSIYNRSAKGVTSWL